MRKMIVSVLACSMMAIGVGTAAAQATCKGKVVIDTAYQKSAGGNKYEYYFRIRNASGGPLRADVRLRNMPHGINLFSPSLPGIALEPYKDKEIKFASGMNNQFNDGVVRKFYDTDDSGNSPAIIVTNCR